MRFVNNSSFANTKHKSIRQTRKVKDILELIHQLFLQLVFILSKIFMFGFRAAIPYYDTMTISFSLRY